MIDQVIHRIKVRQSELQVSLAVGMPVTWEAYQRMVGEHQGMQVVLDIIDTMLDEERNQD
jgi:hypothetical protein